MEKSSRTSALDLTRYVAGGCFIRSAPRSPSRSPDLLPAELISLSPCICPFSVSVYWGWEGSKNHPEALAFGVQSDKLAELEAWSARGCDIDFPNVFMNLEPARAFIDQFLPDHSSLYLLGIALHHDLVDDFLLLKQRAYDPHTQQEIEEVIGVSRAVTERQEIAAGGEVLGFEVVSYEQSLSHSWLCSGLEREMNQLFGIRPNAHGLIDTEAEAMQVCRWIAEDEQQGRRAEPEPYYPWLLIRYPLKEL